MNARARMIAGGWVVVPVVLLALTTPAAAQHPIPESQRWATITHAGNAPFAITGPAIDNRLVGRVDYSYQIGVTEVTTAEWFEFVLAYAPYVPFNNRYGQEFTSFYVDAVETSPGVVQYTLYDEDRLRPANMGWRFAARYVNWLHNGKATNREAFESGVYEVSTFGDIPGGFSDQRVRSADARYWIPSESEWVKAAYFDPNRFGPGQPGYWNYPTTSNTAPVVGPPGAGQTSGGTYSFEPDVASYTNVRSPWGLYDASGGVSEWLEDAAVNSDTGVAWLRLSRGSGAYFGPASRHDFIRNASYGFPDSVTPGLRLARMVPPPATGFVLITVAVYAPQRSRPRCNVESQH